MPVAGEPWRKTRRHQGWPGGPLGVASRHLDGGWASLKRCGLGRSAMPASTARCGRAKAARRPHAEVRMYRRNQYADRMPKTTCTTKLVADLGGIMHGEGRQPTLATAIVNGPILSMKTTRADTFRLDSVTDLKGLSIDSDDADRPQRDSE